MEKVINDYPNYTVDEMGIIRRMRDNKIIAQQTYCGYKCVLLWNEGESRWKKVHRLVAEAFIENPKNFPCVNHKDENKENNSAINLEWCDYKYNNTYGKNAPLLRMIERRRKRVQQYDTHGNLIAEYDSATEAQRQTGIAQSNISKCCLSRPNFKTAGGYIWKFTK